MTWGLKTKSFNMKSHTASLTLSLQSTGHIHAETYQPEERLYGQLKVAFPRKFLLQLLTKKGRDIAQITCDIFKPVDVRVCE